MSVKSAGFLLPLVPARFRETAVEDLADWKAGCLGRQARSFFVSNADALGSNSDLHAVHPESVEEHGCFMRRTGPPPEKAPAMLGSASTRPPVRRPASRVSRPVCR